MSSVECRVCHSMDTTVALSGLRDYVTGESFDLYQCGTCEAAITIPQPCSMDPFYPVHYRRYNRLTVSVLKSLYRWRARSWIRRLGHSGLALEVGCGDGWMLQALRKYGWRVIGSERSIEGVASGPKLTVPLFVGELGAIQAAERFDAIIMFHVLEHLANPVDTLQRCAKLLKRGGRIIIAVPNFNSWQARVFGAAWFHLDVPRHLCHFSIRSLSQALSHAGFKVVHTRFTSFEHDPYGWLQSCLNRVGFPFNLLTKILMKQDVKGVSRAFVLPMLVLSVLLIVPSTLLAISSWLWRSGAVMEVWSVKT